MTEIAPFDPSKLVEEIRARIQATFASMIPEEEWRRLIQREIHGFLHSTEDRHRNRQESGLTKLVTGELDAFFRQRIKDELAKPEWSAGWVNGMAVPGDALRDLLVKNAPVIFAATFGAMFAQAIETMKFQR